MKEINPWNNYWKKKWTDFPDTELVRFIRTKFKGKLKRALDLGMGVGTNSIFLHKEGFKVHAMDSSEIAIKKAKERFTHELADIHCYKGDMSSLLYDRKFFSLVVDICSIQHNKPDDVRKILKEVKRILIPGGLFFSIVRSTEDYLCGSGDFLEPNTYTNIPHGDLQGTGIIHFFALEELKKLLSLYFKDYTIDWTVRTIDNGEKKIKHWVIMCKK